MEPEFAALFNRHHGGFRRRLIGEIVARGVSFSVGTKGRLEAARCGSACRAAVNPLVRHSVAVRPCCRRCKPVCTELMKARPAASAYPRLFHGVSTRSIQAGQALELLLLLMGGFCSSTTRSRHDEMDQARALADQGAEPDMCGDRKAPRRHPRRRRSAWLRKRLFSDLVRRHSCGPPARPRLARRRHRGWAFNGGLGRGPNPARAGSDGGVRGGGLIEAPAAASFSSGYTRSRNTGARLCCLHRGDHVLPRARRSWGLKRLAVSGCGVRNLRSVDVRRRLRLRVDHDEQWGGLSAHGVHSSPRFRAGCPWPWPSRSRGLEACRSSAGWRRSSSNRALRCLAA